MVGVPNIVVDLTKSMVWMFERLLSWIMAFPGNNMIIYRIVVYYSKQRPALNTKCKNFESFECSISDVSHAVNIQSVMQLSNCGDLCEPSRRGGRTTDSAATYHSTAVKWGMLLILGNLKEIWKWKWNIPQHCCQTGACYWYWEIWKRFESKSERYHRTAVKWGDLWNESENY